MMEYSTYYLQPAGMKRSYDHTMDKYLEKDAILDIDAILGIERDEPVLSKFHRGRCLREYRRGLRNERQQRRDP